MTETKLLKLKSLTILNGSLLQLIKSIRAWSGAEGSGEIEIGANEILLCTYCRSVEVSATIRVRRQSNMLEKKEFVRTLLHHIILIDQVAFSAGRSIPNGNPAFLACCI